MPRHKQTDSDREQSLGKFWLGELIEAEQVFEKWYERGQNIIRRYRDERDVSEKKRRLFNILWSNVQVMKPVLYSRMPKPEVTRRFKDKDPVARIASQILERCLEYEVEQYPDYNATMNNVVEDRLLPGRGTAWVRYEPSIVQISEDEDSKKERLEYECAPTDYVHWQDFLHTPARTWEEVWWVARRVWMTRDEGLKRFGDQFKMVPLQQESAKFRETEIPKEAQKNKAQVWEIWDKSDKQVIWVAKGQDTELDVKKDPLSLEDFFPCPKPIYATTTTGTLVPVPDFAEYQDQAEELDLITQRISKLTRALKVAGLYNAEYPEIKRLLNEGTDNELIPVTTWAAFAEKKGMDGAMQFVPLKDVVEVLVRLYEAREQAKQVIYETIGISDILRGASKAQETLGAQQLKVQFGSTRMRASQTDVARFASDLLRLKAHVMCKFFSPQTLVQMSGIQYSLEDPQMLAPALQLLKAGYPQKSFRIEVAADSLVQLDEAKDKAERIELLTAAGAFLEKALAAIQIVPAAAPLLGEMLLFGVRAYRIGKHVEAAFERGLEQLGASMGNQGMPQEQVQQAIEQAKQEERQNAERELGHVRKESQLGVRELKVSTAEKMLGLEEQQVVKELEGIAQQDKVGIDRDKVSLEREKFQAEQSARQVELDSNAAMVKVGEAAEKLQATMREMLAIQASPKTMRRNVNGEIEIVPTLQ